MAKYKESKRLKNKLYLDLLNGEFIKTIDINIIHQVMKNIDSDTVKKKPQAKALVTLLYYSGARPGEILDLKGEDITKEKNYIYLHLKTLKHGKPRKLAIPLRKPYVREAWQYLQQVFPTWHCFFEYRSKYTRIKYSKKGIPREYKEISAKLRYYFKKWFKEVDIPPYFLRHNRFSIMAEKGASDEEIRMAKGAASIASVDPYVHLSQKRAKSFSRYL